MNQVAKSQIAQSTFVATVRTDIRMIASIAKLMESDGSFVGTTGKIASEAIRILSSMSQKVFPVKTYEEAVIELRRMGYNDPMAKGTRYYTAIQKKLGFEHGDQEAVDEMMPIVKNLMDRGIGQTQVLPQVLAEERARAEKVLNIKDEPELSTDRELPERHIYIPKSAPKKKIHTHIRTERDELAERQQLKKAFETPPQAAVIEDDKPSQEESHRDPQPA